MNVLAVVKFEDMRRGTGWGWSERVVRWIRRRCDSYLRREVMKAAKRMGLDCPGNKKEGCLDDCMLCDWLWCPHCGRVE